MIEVPVKIRIQGLRLKTGVFIDKGAEEFTNTERLKSFDIKNLFVVVAFFYI